MAKKATTLDIRKIDKEDLDKFIENQNLINRYVRSLGEITYELETLELQKQQTLQLIQQTQQQAQTHYKEFETENGPGTIDLEKGTFTPRSITGK